MNRALFTSTTCEWPTPQAFFDTLNAEFGFTLDPCATPDNAKCATYFTVDDDGLALSWIGHVVFMNPPYGREIKHWVHKAYESALAGATVVCLLPARTDTSWWHDYVMRGEIRFVRGRLKFGDGASPAPFPSAVVVFRDGLVGGVTISTMGSIDGSNQLSIARSGKRRDGNTFRTRPCTRTDTPSVHPPARADQPTINTPTN